jgi:uncharacterized membrane protein
MNVTIKNTLMAAAVAGLCLAGAAHAADDSSTKTAEKVKCFGVNACKGTGACAGAGHACSGQNGCKGQGFVETSSTECKQLGGKQG